MGLIDLESAVYELRPSPIEARRFGVSVGRATVAAGEIVDGERIRSDFLASSLDVAFLRFHSAHTRLAAQLAGSGIRVLLADSLLYFGTTDLDASKYHSDLITVSADDWPSLQPVIENTFAAYGNHYSANPLFEESDILAGYVEWAHGHLMSEHCRAFAVLCGTEIASIAFVDESTSTVEISLAGTAQAFQRQGHYGKLIAGVEGHYGKAGVERLVISTQLHNVGVIRAWESAGWRYAAGYQTVHLLRDDDADGLRAE